MNTFPSRISLQLGPSTEREPAKERGEEEGWLSLSCVTLLTIVFLVCFRVAADCCQLLIASPCHFTGIFCFGFTWELRGKQIIYMSHPFLTAHFNDYSVFEFSQLFYVPFSPPPPSPLSLCGQENVFCLLIAFKTNTEKNMSTGQLHQKKEQSMHINAFWHMHDYITSKGCLTFCHIKL